MNGASPAKALFEHHFAAPSFTPVYGHMATQPTVRAGQKVTQGQQIGPMGSTGLSTGPHVHFMVQVNGVSQDPARYLP